MNVRLMLISIFLFVNTSNIHAQNVTGEASDDDRLIQYVTDQLKLSLYQQAEASSGVIQLLSSGDLLKIEEISGAYALVTTEDDKKGWVKKGFLVDKPTANILLKEEIVKNESLEEEVEKLKNSKVVIDQYESDMDVLSGKLRVSESKQMEYEQIIDRLKQEKAELIEENQLALDIEEQPEIIAQEISADDALHPTTAGDFVKLGRVYWQVGLPIFIAFLLVSFLIGKKVAEARIIKHFQGVKVW